MNSSSEGVVKVGVGIVIYKDGKVLMGQRKNAHGAGEYCGPGGHLEYMETIEDCAKRETLEEVGIEIENVRFICVTNMRRYGSHHYIDIGVAADYKSGEVTNMEPHKRESWEWYDVDNLPQPLFALDPIYFESMKTGQPFFEDSAYFADAKKTTETEAPKKTVCTLCIPYQGDRILLAMKKRGFGAGRWNGFGGKIKEDETIEASAYRETLEEGGIVINSMDKMGTIQFAWQNRPDTMEVHVYKVTDFSGEPTETEEMRPQWYAQDQIPLDEMWSDDKYWIPHFLAGEGFEASFLFDENDQVLEYEVKAMTASRV